ncbi:MAG: EamA family transporter [Meiothermus sp.]
MQTTSSLSRAGLFHLGVVYIVWGSTYLAFRIGVGPGGGFEPFWMGALRFLVASAILLAFAALQKWRLRLSSSEITMLAVSGVVLWVGGNGLILIASQWAASGYAALLVGTTPIWAALIEGFLDRRRPSGLMIAGLLVGLAGTAVLSVPKLEAASSTTFFAIALLLISPMLWSAGTVYSQRRQPRLEPVVVSAYQQLFGGLAFLVLSPLIGERWSEPSAAGWSALLYLIVAGSLVAYTSFVLAVRLLPLSIVITYAYVNPVVALILGWLILREPITLWTVAGSALILLGVGLVFRSRAAAPGP